jgi:predicted MPP superfamily phosphohydrolase
MIESIAPEAVALPIEYIAANWMGVLLLLLCVVLAADVVTLGGFLWPARTGHIRSWAAALAMLLALIALFQGHRDPVVTHYEVELPGLPPERDGTVLVAFSDIHLGILIREKWLAQMVKTVNELKPHIVVAVGDVVDGNAARVWHMTESMAGLKAPMGVYGVLGNHDFYAGADESARFFEVSGIRLLRDSWAEVTPGLVISGVDDLTARSQFGGPEHPVETALSGRPAGAATIYLSHSPWEASRAASNGARLMISGHTHKGQIWPFTYIVRTRYPYVAGRYNVDGMTLLVGRGTATWGPRMRLWERGEILKLTLRAER